MEENLIELITVLAGRASHLSKMVSDLQLDHAQAIARNHVDNLVETIEEYLQWEKRADVPYVCHVKETMQKIYPETIDYKNRTLVGDDGGFYNFQDLYFHKNPVMHMDNLKEITQRYIAALTNSSHKDPEYVQRKLLPQALVECMAADEDGELLYGDFVKSVLREELILKANKECGFFWMVQAVWDKAKDGWTGTIDTSIEGYADYPVFDNSALCKFVVRSIPHCLVSTWRILKAEYAEGELFDVDVLVDGVTVLQMAKTTLKTGGEQITVNFHEKHINTINMFNGELINLTRSLQWEKAL